jgi:hypothetical protein
VDGGIRERKVAVFEAVDCFLELLPGEPAETLYGARELGDGADSRAFEEMFNGRGTGADADIAAVWTGRGWGLGGADSPTSSMGMVKHQQNCSVFRSLGFGRVCTVGLDAPPLSFPTLVLPLSVFPYPVLPPCATPNLSPSFFLFALLCSNSMSPSLSASVSMLVRSSRMGVDVALGPGLECAERLA